MCGIAGICGPSSDMSLPDRISAMLKAIAHRGPDDEGTYLDPQNRCILGHRRLSIIDPEGGHQPIANEDSSIWVVFNGCIYNYQDLARTLRGMGHHLRTHCDTEVILHAYEQWGPGCVEQFNGMWSFAIWDSRNGRLFCSRDRLGVKPFYYTFEGGELRFASEIKALLQEGKQTGRLSSDGLRQYLTFQFCLEETTMFEGVHCLPPGCSLTFHVGHAPQVQRYWDLSFQIDTEHDEAYFVDRLSWLLEDAVRLRLRADVPLGAHLSGGLDSSTVVCLARMLLGSNPIKTFTGAFDGKAFDESQYARLVSKAANTEYIDLRLGPQDFADSIESIIYFMDQPAAGPGVFPQFLVSRCASQHVKVVLGGQGGDELFIGYARYLVAYLEECLKGAITDTAHRGQYVATLETIVPSLPTLEAYVPMLKNFWAQELFEPPARRYFRLMDRFADSSRLLSSDMHVDHDKTFGEFEAIFNSHGAAAMINRILCFDLKGHLASLLQVEDRTSMAWGLESRVPLLDYRLVELMASIPPTIKFRNGTLKHLFRQSVRNIVPQQVFNRRDKMGFPVPLTDWFRGELQPFLRDVLLGKTCRERGIFNPSAIERAIAGEPTFGRSLWGALCTELWFQRFVDRPCVG